MKSRKSTNRAMKSNTVKKREANGRAANGREAKDRAVARTPLWSRILIGIVAVTTFETDEYLFAALQAGASGFVLKDADPGDLVLDPTCGSGTTAYVAEQWGRRWITTDTSRVALNIAKTRLMTATFPWYTLHDEKAGLQRELWDVRHGFDYKKVQRITLGSLANDEPPEEVTLFDQPAHDKKKLRIAGPFTVETLQSFEPLSPDSIAEASLDVAVQAVVGGVQRAVLEPLEERCIALVENLGEGRLPIDQLLRPLAPETFVILICFGAEGLVRFHARHGSVLHHLFRRIVELLGGFVRHFSPLLVF